MRKLVLVFTVGCLVSLSGCQSSKQGYLAKGNKMFDAGKYADADLNYRKALQKDPKYGEAFYRLGLAQLKEQKPREAFNTLYQAVQLLPTNLEARALLGGLSLRFYFADSHRPQFLYDLVRRSSNELLARDPKSFEGLREKAYLAMTDGQREEAVTLFRKALEVHPSDAVVTSALIRTLFEAGDHKQAEQLALHLIAQQKDYGHVYDLLYQWYLKNNRGSDAENILKTKVENNPKQPASLVELATHYAQAQKLPEMRATLQRLLDDPEDFPQARMWVGDFYFKLKNYSEARRFFEDGAGASSGNEKVLYQKRAADAWMGEGKGAQASSTVDQIVAENPKDQDARHVQANLLLRSGDPEKIDAAEREFQELSKEQPDNASIWLGLGRAEELKGNLDQARIQYLEALKKNKQYLQARYALAAIALLQRQPDETLKQTDEILKVSPDAPRARLLRAQALMHSGNPATARSELKRLVADFPRDIEAQVELGLLALSEKKFQEAEQIFSKLNSSGDPRATAGLARSYAAQKQFDKAAQVLEEGLKKSNNSPLLLSQLAGIQATAGKYDAAISTFEKLIVSAPRSVEARLGLAEVFALKGDNSHSLAMCREAAKLVPLDLATGLRLAKALEGSGLQAEAGTQYQAMLTAHPDDALALNNVAYYMAENGGNLDQALGYAHRALKKMPEEPGLSDTIGCIYLKKGLRDSALQVFGNLVKKYPNYPTFRYHLGMALIEKGDRSGAKKELETALAAHPSVADEARIKSLLGKIG